ncbi:MAG: phosphoglycerate kinase [Coriobacteriales bacterium]|jgi:phosphoglycerate kinase|nr:phosphoglycerate kinase [Coriobacteriales bacterium]
MRSIREAEVAGKRVLVRVDFNVPLADGTVTDDTRIRAVLPTINYLIDAGATPILMSHLGRPAGTGYEKGFSLAPVARVLSRLLGREVHYLGNVCFQDSLDKLKSLPAGEVAMLENLRFDPRDKNNDPSLAQELATLADIYVNDAFGAAHRAHASVVGVPKLLPSYAGLLLQKELDTLTGMLKEPARPFVAVLGGSKVSDKIKVIDSLLDVADCIIIGGAMCFTFLAAEGYQTGSSLKEDDWLQHAANLRKSAAQKGVRFLLPTDVVAATHLDESAACSVYGIDEIPANMMGLDIGPVTAEAYANAIAAAQTVYWNGPMGVFELKPFAAGTLRVAKAVAANKQATTIIGGGDSVAAIKKFGLAEEVSFISTGGGASMQLVEGVPLPGVEALRCAKEE